MNPYANQWSTIFEGAIGSVSNIAYTITFQTGPNSNAYNPLARQYADTTSYNQLILSNSATKFSWNHLVMTAVWETPKRLELCIFMNGVLDTCAPFTFTVNVIDTARPNSFLGKQYGGAFFSGQMAEIAMYNYALSPTQVAAHYAAGLSAAPPPPPLPPAAVPLNVSVCGNVSDPYRVAVLRDRPWGWWRMAETSGTTLLDCSSNGTHAGGYTALTGTLNLGYYSSGLGPGSAAYKCGRGLAPALPAFCGSISPPHPTFFFSF